jgi:hypothetical protein
MSRGSTFVILRRNSGSVKVTKEQVMEKYKDWYDCLGKSLVFDDLPDITYYDKRTYVDKNTMELLTELVQADFTSSFTSLIEHYYLSYYNESGRKDRVVISAETARNMLQAVKYLMYEDYSKRLEELINSEWIEVFSELCPDYLKWKHNEDYEDEDSIWYLKRLKQVLETFLFIHSESDHDDGILLLYFAWG